MGLHLRMIQVYPFSGRNRLKCDYTVCFLQICSHGTEMRKRHFVATQFVVTLHNVVITTIETL